MRQIVLAALLTGAGAVTWSQGGWSVGAAGLPLHVVPDLVRRDRPLADVQSIPRSGQVEVATPATSSQPPTATLAPTGTPPAEMLPVTAPPSEPAAASSILQAGVEVTEPSPAVDEAITLATALPAVSDVKPAETLPPSAAAEATPTSLPPATTTPRPAPTVTPRPVWTATPSVSQSARVTHVIESGDTLSGLARRYNTTVDAIVRLNNMVEPDKLAVGTRLLIPR